MTKTTMPGRKIFNHRSYSKYGTYTNKWGVDRVVNGLRKKGFLARVSKENGDYIIWFTTK